jgi:hypothetical protein
VWLCYSRGWTLWYGDAEAHLNIARRLFDSMTPGYSQVGTPWLPLTHLLLAPFASVDSWWLSGIAAAFPSAVCFVVGGVFFFAAVRRIFESTAAAATATAMLALNPNLLYLQSTSMTEPVFLAVLAALLYFTAQGKAAASGVAALAGSLTRYEGWFLIPFVAVYFLRKSWRSALLFLLIASSGPFYWFAHNWWLTGDALYFYRGPGSAAAIQGNAYYPGKHNWYLSVLYFTAAARLCAGSVLVWAGIAGALCAFIRRVFWPLLLLALPPIFYIWSLHSSGTPIFVPHLWPHSYYNTRYGLAALPLFAFAAGALPATLPRAGRNHSRILAAIVILSGFLFWAVHSRPADWITWAESRANSIGRRAWTQKAAAYLKPRFRKGSGIISSSGDDFAGIYRSMGIPLRETFTICNGLIWDATVLRPELWLWQEWAVVRRGDPVDRAIARAAQFGLNYRLEQVIREKDEPVILIYRRKGEMHGPA